MTESTIYLSPNGQNTTTGDGPATRMRIATLDGVCTLERDGATWRVAGRTLAGRHVGSLIVEPRSGKLYAGCHKDGGLWVSDDGAGAEWRELTAGLNHRHIYSLARRDVGGAVTLFAGTEPAALYKSDDLGESWTELPSLAAWPARDKWTFPPPPHWAHVKGTYFHPDQPKTIFALVEQGAMLKSTDDGESWVELDDYSEPDDEAYRDVHRMLLHPDDPDRIYLATGVGLYVSADGGRSWDRRTTRDDRIGYPEFLFLHPDNPGLLYMAGAGLNPGRWRETRIAYAGVQTTTDEGRTWRELDDGLPKPAAAAFEAMALHSWPGGFQLVIGTATGEIYLSEDEGASWQRIAENVSPVSKDGHYRAFVQAA